MRANSKRKESLLNEYKGNLYEFLVARELSQKYQIEAEFIRRLRPDFQQMLAQQEAFVREYYPELLIDLPRLAKGLADKLSECLPESPTGLTLIGKAASGEEAQGEADILLSFENVEDVPISVKLSKAQAFVNTKSAGIKSFIKKYFGAFEGNEEAQEMFSSFFDREFDRFSRAVHDSQGVEYSEDFDHWKSEGLTQLPGELGPEERAIFLGLISSVSNRLFEIVTEFYEKAPAQFAFCLRPCLGHSVDGLWQAATFYKTKGQNYELFSHEVERLDQGSGLKLVSAKNRADTSSFDLVFEDRVLQIRIKAMNRFTGKGFKVNCAVKRLYER